MKPNNGKKTKLILTILICALITVGVTVGIGCYNYYGYDKYKTDFLDDFFALDSSMSNQDKIEHAVKWDYNDYIKHPGKLTFYDPGDFDKNMNHKEKTLLTDTPSTSTSSMFIGSYYKDGILHLADMFDLELYLTHYVDESSDVKYDKITYNFFLSNIKEYTLFEIISEKYRAKTEYLDYTTVNISEKPYDYDIDEVFKHIYISFVPGTDDEAKNNLRKLTESIEGGKDTMNEFDLGDLSSEWKYSYTSSSTKNTDNPKSLADYVLYDNVDNDALGKRLADDKSKIKYISLKNSDKLNGSISSYAAENLEEGFSFVLYYYDAFSGYQDDEAKYWGDGIVLLEGEFTPDKVDGKIANADNFKNFTNVKEGSGANIYNSDYNSFIKKKIILSCSITFVITGALTGVLGWIWSIDLIQPSEATNKNRKKKQKNKIVIKNK